MDTINRLQFRHHSEIFETREEAINYIEYNIRYAQEGLAHNDPSYGYSLLAEPTVLLYKNEEDESDPHLILVIGSATNNDTQYSYNRFCIIDIDKTEKEIVDLQKEIEDVVKSLSIFTTNSDTLNLFKEKTEDGTLISGDVKVCESHVFDDNVQRFNNLMVTSEGLFIYVKLAYDEERETFTFTINNKDGELEHTSVKLPNNYVVSGEYKPEKQAIYLNMRDGGEPVEIDCTNLIAEWTVDAGSKTPIILKKDDVFYDNIPPYEHVEPWQDILSADIRLKDETIDPNTGEYVRDANSTNIINRTIDGRALYVDGMASNIIYYKDGQKTNVKEVLDELNNIRISTDSNNIIVNKVDGFFASSELEYVSNENKLIFKVSSVDDNGEIIKKIKEIKLNTVEFIDQVFYDHTKEELVIAYTDSNGETKYARIPIGEILDEWHTLNEGHNVELIKTREPVGTDLLSADVKIATTRSNNILEDINHELYVNGVASNINYDVTGDTTVKNVLDNLSSSTISLDNKINQEITNRIADVDAEESRAISEETRINATIGSGFTENPYENVTYKFNELTDRVSTEETRAANEESRIETKLDGEISRSTTKDAEHDGKIEAIETEIGEGFGPRNTVRDEINALSANTTASLKDIINNDNSINVDKTNQTEPIIKVNLSSESGNTIRLEGDGLYEFVDVDYNPTTNVLKLIKSANGSTENVEKEIQLNCVSVIDSIEYDPTTESLIIRYHSGSEAKELVIPLGEIFQEWEVYNDPNSAIVLTRTRVIDGKDKLSGVVTISTAHTDNILVNEHGALYVTSSGITANANAISELTNNLNNEIIRASSTENALNDKITSAETVLQTAINNEVIARQNAIIMEASARTEGDAALNNSITIEVTRATSAETALQTALNNEVTRATSAETVLNTSIRTDVFANVEYDNVNHIINFKNANGTVIGYVNADDFIKDGMVNDAYVRNGNLVIVFNTDAGKENIEIPISDIFNANNYYTKDEVDALQATQDGRIAANTQAIADERTRATTAENSLNTQISAEVSRAEAAEELLGESINNFNTLLVEETTRAQEAEAVLQTNINNEATARVNADNAINNRINAITASSLTIIQGGSTTVFNPGGQDKTISITGATKLSDLTNDLKSLTWGIGAPTADATGFNGSAQKNINIPNSVQHLSEWYSNALNINGGLNVTSTVNVTGTITCQSAIYSSDINLKENIKQADTFKQVAANKIDVKEFNFKDDVNKSKVYGVIAQEVEAQGLNEVVYTKEDGYKAVDYTSLMMLKIAYLENENRSLRGELMNLSKRLEKLKKSIN